MDHIEPIFLEVWAFDQGLFPEKTKKEIEIHLSSCDTCRLFVNRMRTENDSEKLRVAIRAVKRQFHKRAE